MSNISSSDTKQVVIPKPTLLRIPVYLQLLKRKYCREGVYISSTEIAEKLGLKPIQVRKDLEMAGAKGKPKIGYNSMKLIKALEEFLGYNNSNEAFLVGCGNLGSALLGYKGFTEFGISITAAFDTNMNTVGTEIHGHRVLHFEKFSNLADRLKVKIAILSVPAENAQDTAELLCASGIKAIWNFAPVHLKVPDDVAVQNENIAASLAVLVKKYDVISKREKEYE